MLRRFVHREYWRRRWDIWYFRSKNAWPQVRISCSMTGWCASPEEARNWYRHWPWNLPPYCNCFRTLYMDASRKKCRSSIRNLNLYRDLALLILRLGEDKPLSVCRFPYCRKNCWTLRRCLDKPWEMSCRNMCRTGMKKHTADGLTNWDSVSPQIRFLLWKTDVSEPDNRCGDLRWGGFCMKVNLPGCGRIKQCRPGWRLSKKSGVSLLLIFIETKVMKIWVMCNFKVIFA